MSSQPRPVPKIGRGPQAFRPADRPPVAHPMQLPPAAVPSDEVSPDELAMEIYCRVAAQFIASGRADRAILTGLALHAQIAAEAYFQTMTGEQFHAEEETSSQG